MLKLPSGLFTVAHKSLSNYWLPSSPMILFLSEFTVVACVCPFPKTLTFDCRFLAATLWSLDTRSPSRSLQVAPRSFSRSPGAGSAARSWAAQAARAVAEVDMACTKQGHRSGSCCCNWRVTRLRRVDRDLRGFAMEFLWSIMELCGVTCSYMVLLCIAWSCMELHGSHGSYGSQGGLWLQNCPPTLLSALVTAMGRNQLMLVNVTSLVRGVTNRVGWDAEMLLRIHMLTIWHKATNNQKLTKNLSI